MSDSPAPPPDSAAITTSPLSSPSSQSLSPAELSNSSIKSDKSSSAFFHHTDPLDIPLIDHHLTSALLLPRIISAVRYLLPQLYLDWTLHQNATQRIGGVDGNANDDTHGSTVLNGTAFAGGYSDANLGYFSDENYSDAKLFWKKVVQMTLHLALLIGSCSGSARRGRVFGSDDGNGGQEHHDLSISTPGMKSFGIFLRPTTPHDDSSHRGDRRRVSKNNAFQAKLKSYGKIASLAFLSVIVPFIYQELKARRHRQLELLERERRYREYRRQFPSASSRPSSENNHDANASHVINDNPAQSLLSRRATIRQTKLIDLIIGFGEIIIPPLRLISYCAYLCGGINLLFGKLKLFHTNTPSLAMRLSGWEYHSLQNYQNQSDQLGQSGSRYHRHANFLYANRRLMVEEALNTAAILFPRRDATAGIGVGGGIDAGTETRGRAPAFQATNNRYATQMINPNRPNSITNANARTDGLDRRQALGTSFDGDGRSLALQHGDSQSDSQRSYFSRIANATHKAIGKKGWLRKRALSFMGVVEDKDDCDKESTTEETRLPQCSLCHTNYPTVPYITTCGHCYCYVCLRMAVTDDLSFRCVVCGKTINSSKRWTSTQT